MAKKTKKEKDSPPCKWAAEMADGWERALQRRLELHQALSVDEVALHTARTPQTVRNWFGKLVDRGIAQFKQGDDDLILPTAQ